MSSFKLMGDPDKSAICESNVNHLISDMPLSSESNVATFEVGPGDRAGLLRELVSKEFDFGDNTLDKKIKSDL